MFHLVAFVGLLFTAITANGQVGNAFDDFSCIFFFSLYLSPHLCPLIIDSFNCHCLYLFSFFALPTRKVLSLFLSFFLSPFQSKIPFNSMDFQ